MPGIGLSEQEKFERSNGSTLCRAQLIFGKCSAEDCHWKHNKEPGDVVPLCREHFLRKKDCPRTEKCPLIHVQSGIDLPSNVLKEAQVIESGVSLSQISGPSSGAGGDSFGRQHASKQQRDAVMASVKKTRVDSRGANKAKSASEAQDSVMNGGVSLASETNLPQVERPMDCNTPSPRHATDLNITIGRPDKGATTSACIYDDLDATESRYFETFQNRQANYANDPRGGAAPALSHSQSSWDISTSHSQSSWDISMSHSQSSWDNSMSRGPISSPPPFNSSPKRHTSYQGMAREAPRPPFYQNDVIHDRRVMNYDQPPQPMRTQGYYPRMNYQNNGRNTFHRNESGFQENFNGGRYHNQVFNRNTALPRANNTGGSQQNFRPGGQSSANSGPIDGFYSVSASPTDPAPLNRNGSKPAVNIQDSFIQAMKNTGGIIPSARDVMSQKRNGGRGSFRGFGASHPCSLGRGIATPQISDGRQPQRATRPGIESRQGQINYNHHPMVPPANGSGNGFLNTGGFTNSRGTTARQQFLTLPRTNGYAEYPIDRGYQPEYSLYGNNASASGMFNLVRERHFNTATEDLMYSSVGSSHSSNNTAIRSPQNHNPGLNTSERNYQIERRNSSQDRKSLYPMVNGDTTSIVNQSPPNRRVEDGHTPIDSKHQTDYIGKQSFAGPPNQLDDNHLVKHRGIKNYEGVELRRRYQSGGDMGKHEPGILHEQGDSSDSESQCSGTYTPPKLSQPADFPIRHSPEPSGGRSAVWLYYSAQREKNHEMNPNRAESLLNPWSLEKNKQSSSKVSARNHERTSSEDKLALAASLRKPGQFARGNAHVSEEKSVEKEKAQPPPLSTPVPPLTLTPSLPAPAPPAPSLPAPEPPTPFLPAPAPSTPSLPAPEPPAPSLTLPALLVPSLPAPAPPTPSLPAPAPSTPSLPAPAPPTPSLPASESPAPSLTPLAPLAPPAPSLPAPEPPASSLPAPAPPTPSLPAPVPSTPSLPAPEPPAPSLTLPALLVPSLPAPPPPTPSLPAPAPSAPSLPAPEPPAPSLTLPALLVPSLPAPAPPTPSLPAPAPSTPSLPAPAPPTPSLPASESPAPSLTPLAPLAPPAPPAPSLPAPEPPASSLPAPEPPTPFLPAPAPSTPFLPAPAPSTPSLPAPEPSTPFLPAPAPSTPSLPAPEPPAPSLTPPAPAPSLTTRASSLPPLSSSQPSASVAVRASKPNPRNKKRNGKAKPSAPVAVPAGVSVSTPAHIPENIPVPAPPQWVGQNTREVSFSGPRVAKEKLEFKPHTIPQKETCWLCHGHHEAPCQADSLVSSKTRGKQVNDDDGTWDFQGISKHWSDDEFVEKQMTKKTKKNKGRATKAHLVIDLPDQDDNGGVPLGKFMGAETAQSTKMCPRRREKKKFLREGVPLDEDWEREELVPEEFLEASKFHGSRSVMVKANGNHFGGYFDSGKSGVRKLPEDILTTIFSYLADGLMPEDQMEAKNVHIGNSFRFDNSFTTTRYRRLGAVLRSCHYWRYLGQQIVCKYINLTKLQSFRRFVRTISEDEELGNMVRAIKVNIHSGASYMTYDRRLSKDTLVEMPKVDDLAQLFTRMMQSCPQLQVLSVNMHGAIMGFNVVSEKFPMMREIQIKDDRSKGVVAQNIWTNLSKNYPNLENFRIFHSQENAAINFDTLRIAPKFFQLKGTNEIILKALTMERCPELSDRSLIALSPKLKNLTTLVIVDCKLVTSGGLARAIEKLPDPSQITRFIYFVWVDPFGKATPDEMSPTRSHLCTTIRDRCTNVSYLCWKPYRICGDFWKDSNFHSLERCRIEPMLFKDCDKDVCDHSKFTEAYKQAQEEERLPKLEEDRVFFDFYF